MAGIAYVYQGHYPWDVRVEKICESIADSDQRCVIISRNTTGAATLETVRHNLEIRRLARAWGKRTRDLLNFPAFFSPFWLFKIAGSVRELRLDLIIVRDLPLSPAAWLAGKGTGVPVVLDMAENYPAMTRDTWKFGRPKPLDYLVRNPHFLNALEGWVLPRMNGILAVSEASAERVRQLVRSVDTQVCVVGNTPRIGRVAEVQDRRAPAGLGDIRGLKLLYVGGLEAARGLDVVVRALPHVKKQVPDISLVIVGDSKRAGALHSAAAVADVSKHVYFTGWLDPDQVPAAIQAADICIVPHYVTEHTDSTIPNKLYDYMLQAKPVLVTHSRALRAIVERFNCGLSYRDDDPMDLAKSVLKLADPGLRAKMGMRGAAAVRSELNWSYDEQVLLEFLRKVVEGHRR